VSGAGEAAVRAGSVSELLFASGSRKQSCLDQPVAGSRRVPVVALLGTCVLHAAVLGLALLASMRADGQRQTPAAIAPLELSVMLLPKPEPATEPPTEPTSPPPVAAVVPARPKAAVRTPPAAPASPSPSAAEAGRVLAAADDVVDFGETIVTGKGASYAGGVSANEGSSKQPVYDKRAQAGGVPGGSGTDSNADATRAPRLAGGSSWKCPFPPEADDEGIDQAVVTLRVEVAAEGGVLDVRATADPGHGFAREARRCAQQKRWDPGLDRAGRPARAIALVNVRFER
jgi:protein TonB